MVLPRRRLQTSPPHNKYTLQINDWHIEQPDPDLDLNLGNNSPIRIGIDANGSYPFTGQAAKLWIINATLTPANLTHIYTNQKVCFS